MTPEDLAHQLASLISGEIAESDHEQLQSLLKSDPAARAALRERMDLEAGLRTWAAENVPSASGRDPEQSTLRFGRSPRFVLAGSVLGAIAAGLLIVVGVVLDTMRQLEAQMMMRNYEGFIS